MPPSTGFRSRLTAAHRLLAREMGAFGVVGSAAFVVDVGLFQLLYVAGVEAVVAKLVATLVSMTAAYLGHRYWSFSHRERPGVGREYVTFALVNGVTLLLGLAVIGFVRHVLMQESALVLQAANVGSIVAGTVVRFLSYRRWVFPARAQPAGDGRPAAAPLG
ncbi:GtrA family protein [Geodermatophilus sp. YIM 151500]|uniref:GtrA family protein n=1 Tax=Geodermatophilus sp. YIM 151500 TaxID=2984531 RepID=UPI0021E50455|nr:GtrA family protein [Geodermatophilus sp. YIM 151500]MCV2488550.1 GtrA family protein [Geodermatophilus sp. YIM 151500]